MGISYIRVCETLGPGLGGVQYTVRRSRSTMLLMICPLVMWFIFHGSYTPANAIGSCLLNKCLCTHTTVRCDGYPHASPIFTTGERLYVHSMAIRWGQVAWMEGACSKFPRLTDVVVGINEPASGMTCPKIDRCPQITIRCL